LTAYPDIGTTDPEWLDRYGGRYCLRGRKKGAYDRNPLSIKTHVCLLVGKLRQAINEGNGQFFRNLADAIDRFDKPPVDKMREWLAEKFYVELSQDGTVAEGWENSEIPGREITLRRLHEEMKKEGIPGDERQLRRACKELGILLAKARRGRPKGKPGTSRDPNKFGQSFSLIFQFNDSADC
jgi:hypothetical protein